MPTFSSPDLHPQITLPRAAGTCTRVPTEVRLHEDADQWTCKIMLRFETDEHGNVGLFTRML